MTELFKREEMKVANEMKQLRDGRSNSLKKTESDTLQLNVTNSVLMDNKKLDSYFKKIDCTSENDSLLKNACFDNTIDNRKLRSEQNRTYAEALSETKHICAEPVKDIQKIGKSTLGKADHKA